MIVENAYLYITLACVFGFFMAWGIGANDVANAMGTSVGSKALTLTQALIIAAIFETAGALLAGGQVTQTIRGEIISPQAFAIMPHLLVFGMMAALLAAGLWLLIASYFGWPVSTTHSIVGAIIGFGIVVLGVHAIAWDEVMAIGISWVITPIISGIIAYLVFRTIQFFIINSAHPFENAKRYLPIYIFFVALVIALVTLFKGIKHIGLQLSTIDSITIALLVSVMAMSLSYIVLRRVTVQHGNGLRSQYKSVEQVFAVLMIFTASCMAFAHGSNDVANAIGPLAAIIAIIKSGGAIAAKSHLPTWELLLGAVGIVTGLAMYGYRVIATIGKRITQLTPSRGFAAEFATATTVVIASGTGLPISTTQTLVGAVLGVGFARGIGSLDLKIIRNIFMSWIITLPAGAILAVIFFYLLRFLFGL